MKLVIRDDEKKDKAVSAIIGTILIVAITVVLAATLYAVLGGFGGLIGKPTPTASMTVSETGSGASEVYAVTFTSVSSNLSLSNTQLKIVNGSGTFVASFSGPNYSFTGTGSGIHTNVSGGTYLTFNTLISITGSKSTITSIYLIDTQTGGTIASQTNL
ncbi:MAG: archaellin/type IV pilin N-terminal domain-containing protein [Thermoplasmatales archaeon]